MGVGKEGSGHETVGGGSSLGKELLVKPENRRFLVRRAEPRRALAKQVWLPHLSPQPGSLPPASSDSNAPGFQRELRSFHGNSPTWSPPWRLRSGVEGWGEP